MNPNRPLDPEHLLQRVEWTVLKRLDGRLQGNYRTLFQGMGIDFSDLRIYQAGDDVRTIDWNVTARMNEPHVRRFHEDRELQAWFLIDTSPSVDFGTNRTKRQVAADLTAALASLLTRGGNHVGACFFDGHLPRLYPAAGGRNAVLALLSGFSLPPPPQASSETNLTELFDAMGGVLRRRSLVFVVSDFYSQPGWEPHLAALGRRHEVLTVRLSDPAETQLPDAGFLWLQDSETGDQVLVDSSDPRFRSRLTQHYQDREQALEGQFRSAAADPLELSTADDLVRTLLGWAEQRRYRKHHSGGVR